MERLCVFYRSQYELVAEKYVAVNSPYLSRYPSPSKHCAREKFPPIISHGVRRYCLHLLPMYTDSAYVRIEETRNASYNENVRIINENFVVVVIDRRVILLWNHTFFIIDYNNNMLRTHVPRATVFRLSRRAGIVVIESRTRL